MRKTSSRLLILLLCWLNLLLPAAHSQTTRRKPRSEVSHLYQVSIRDNKTGERRIGFIDRTGKLVIGFDRLPRTTETVGEFHEGRAAIYLNREKNGEATDTSPDSIGFIDEAGNVVIAPRFRFARDFSEGLAYVETEGFSGFIDREGRRVIKINDELRANDFHEGLAAIGNREWWKKDESWGYLDRTGKMVIKQQYQFEDDFSEGLAGVAVAGKYGFINRSGEMVIPPRFGLRREYRHTNRILSSGRFSEGLACVRLGDLYGYLNQRGEFVIAPQFNQAQEFSEGLAWVVKDGASGVMDKVGWIDQTGRWNVTKVNGRDFSIYPESIGYTSHSRDWRYAEGLVPFFVYLGKNVLWGYMDKRGQVAIKPMAFNLVGPFSGGVAQVSFYMAGVEVYGYIDKKGRLLWPPEQNR